MEVDNDHFKTKWKQAIKKMGRTYAYYGGKTGLSGMEISVILSKQPEIIRLSKLITKDLKQCQIS